MDPSKRQHSRTRVTTPPARPPAAQYSPRPAPRITSNRVAPAGLLQRVLQAQHRQGVLRRAQLINGTAVPGRRVVREPLAAITIAPTQRTAEQRATPAPPPPTSPQRDAPSGPRMPRDPRPPPRTTKEVHVDGVSISVPLGTRRWRTWVGSVHYSLRLDAATGEVRHWSKRQ